MKSYFIKDGAAANASVNQPKRMIVADIEMDQQIYSGKKVSRDKLFSDKLENAESGDDGSLDEDDEQGSSDGSGEGGESELSEDSGEQSSSDEQTAKKQAPRKRVEIDNEPDLQQKRNL
jgi:hypothetical protein